MMDRAHRAAALAVLFVFAAGSAALPQGRAKIDKHIHRLHERGSETKVRKALSELRRLGPDAVAAASEVARLVTDPHPTWGGSLRASALWALDEIAPCYSIELLLTLVREAGSPAPGEELPAGLASSAILQLRHCPEDQLCDLASDPNWALAHRALAGIKDGVARARCVTPSTPTAAIERAFLGLNDTSIGEIVGFTRSPTLRQEALVQLDNPELATTLAVESENPELRAEAAFLVKHLVSDPAVLRRIATEDPDPRVRAAARKASSSEAEKDLSFAQAQAEACTVKEQFRNKNVRCTMKIQNRGRVAYARIRVFALTVGTGTLYGPILQPGETAEYVFSGALLGSSVPDSTTFRISGARPMRSLTEGASSWD